MSKRQDSLKDTSPASLEKEAMSYALKVLGVSPKSRKQLMDKMQSKGYQEGVIAQVIRKLEAAGYINDPLLAEGLVNRMASSRKGFGKRKAAFELKRRGFDDAVSSAALESMTRDIEIESAQELARTVWERGKKLVLLKRRKKVFDALVRRGFDYETAQRSMAVLARECRAEEDSNEEWMKETE